MNLLRFPDPKLTQPSEECIESDLPFIKANYDEMKKIMKQYKGYGLAAVQVGIHKRFCLMENKIDPEKPSIIINPVILEQENLEKKDEGCLSLPLFLEKIDRYGVITVQFKDENWQDVKAVMYGIEAQCFQHEIDHMQGELIKDKVSMMKRDMYLKKLKKKGVL